MRGPEDMEGEVGKREEKPLELSLFENTRSETASHQRVVEYSPFGFSSPMSEDNFA